MQEFSFHVFEAFSAATVIYILVNVVVVNLMRFIEHRVRVPGLIAMRHGRRPLMDSSSTSTSSSARGSTCSSRG